MPRLTETDGLTDLQRDILGAVREFVEAEIIPVAGLILDDCRVPAARVLGERPGRGFYQMMDGIEVGRVNVAARACGVAHRAFELAIGYA
jgi:hypothetical protein